jgi:hypothetical protein
MEVDKKLELESENSTETPNEPMDTSASTGSAEGDNRTNIGKTLLNKKSSMKNFALSSSTLFPGNLDADFKSVFKTAFQLQQPTTALEETVEEEINDFEIVGESTKEVNIIKVPLPPKSSPFVSAAITESQRTVTENDAPTFSTSDDPRLDFFFGVMEQSQKARTVELLKESWSMNPLDTLKLLANLRDIRDGKGIRPQYQECLYWLYQHHPKTLHDNLSLLVNYGYWKDILHVLVIILFDGYIPPYFQKDANPKPQTRPNYQPSKYKIQRHRKQLQKKDLDETQNLYNARKNPTKFKLFSKSSIEKAQAGRKAVDDEKRIYNQKILDFYRLKKEIRELSGKEMTSLRLQYAREKFASDAKYRVFHTKVAQVFASQLIQDVDEMKKLKGEKKEVSLAGKWAPSLEAHFDRYTLIASAIALEIVKQRGGAHLDILTKSIPVATYLARKLYNKEYCIPLRRFLDVPEHFIAAKEFQRINYKRVAAKCMNKNKETFVKHDEDRFVAYLLAEDSKVAGASLKPVELIYKAMELDSSAHSSSIKDKDWINRIIVEKQWTSLCDSVKSSGGGMLRNAVAVCDVSGSMSGVPMQAAIGLTLLTMNSSEEPWNSICITFSEYPQIFNLDMNLGLMEKLKKLKAMPWGMNTDLQSVFELIVNLGKKKGLSDDQMPKILFIFTDMEFDVACPGNGRSGETNFEIAKQMFVDAGYSMPAIVFWNLRDSSGPHGTSTPVQKNELGVSLLSGFSGQMLSYIMQQDQIPEDDEDAVVIPDDGDAEKVLDTPVKKEKPNALAKMTPLTVMLGILANEKYSSLAIYD